jgi:hypothetical protein
LEDLKKYIKDALGIEIEFGSLKPDKLKTLPLYIENEYNFQLIKLFRKDILLVFVKHSFASDKLRKHLDIIQATFNITTVAIIHQLESYNRLRLIEKKVPFIIPGKQMYLPDLLIDLKEFGSKPKEQPLSMQPATQLLVLYHLQVEPLEGINLKGIAEKLRYDSMTITRAAYYLHNTEICTLEGSKDKFLHFQSNKKELWKKVEPLMSSPVKKTTYHNGSFTERDKYKSNINALAHYTDLNDDVIEYYAVKPGYKRWFKSSYLKETSQLEGNIYIEEWKYDPYLLKKEEYIDPLSLYLCFRNNPDERIEMALEELINKLEW